MGYPPPAARRPAPPAAGHPALRGRSTTLQQKTQRWKSPGWRAEPSPVQALPGCRMKEAASKIMSEVQKVASRLESHFSKSIVFYSRRVHCHTQAGAGGDGEGTILVECERFAGNVARIITVRSRNVTGQRKARQRSQCQVRGAAHVRFQHAPAPDRDARLTTQLMDFDCLARTANAPGLDVDHAASLHFERVARMARREDRFVQADGRVELLL